MSERAEHWDNVYARSASERLGWHQPQIATLGLVTAHSTATTSVLDVGGGDSRLVDDLLERGYEDVSVLDLSRVVLTRARERLGTRGAAVSWIEADVTDWTPTRPWDLWHDRALFHFLNDARDRDSYISAAHRALRIDGILIVATFSTEAPETCSGLPVRRYDSESLVAEFAAGFDVLSAGPLPPASTSEGDQRPFVAAAFQRRNPSAS